MQKSKESWMVRAAAWELVSFTFRYPKDELVKSISSGEWFETAKEITTALEIDLPESFAASACADFKEDSVKLLHMLRAEATRLFVGAPEPICSPYEGVWRATDEGVQALLFVNPHSMAVERFCSSCGLGRPKGTNEPLDHIATEAELLQYLASLQAGIITPVTTTPRLSDLPGGSAQAAYGIFLDEHARKWIARFAAKTVEASRLPFYRAAGIYLAAILE